MFDTFTTIFQSKKEKKKKRLDIFVSPFLICLNPFFSHNLFFFFGWNLITSMLQSSKYYKTYGHTLTRNSNKPDPKKNRINELNKYKQTNKKSNNDIFTLTWNPNKVKVIKKSTQ